MSKSMIIRFFRMASVVMLLVAVAPLLRIAWGASHRDRPSWVLIPPGLTVFETMPPE